MPPPLRLGLLIAVVVAAPSAAQVRSTPAGGAWEDPATWVGAAAPGEDVDVVVAAGATVTVEAPFEDTVVGALTLEDAAVLRGNGYALLIDGDLLVRGTLEGFSNVTVRGALVNEGVFAPTTADTYGDVTNLGRWGALRLNLSGTSRRTVRADGVGGTVAAGRSFEFPDPEPPRVVLEGDNHIPMIRPPARGGDVVVVAPGGQLKVDSLDVGLGSGDSSWLFNYGHVVFPYPYAGAYAPDDRIEGVGAVFTLDAPGTLGPARVTTYGRQAPASFPNAVRRWWRVGASAPPDGAAISKVVFGVDGAELGGAEVEGLAPYHSADGGLTWERLGPDRISHQRGTNVWGDPRAWVTVEGAFPLEGDYLLAEAAPVAQRPELDVDIIGRDEIRVGGPEAAYLVTYANTGPVPLYRGLLSLETYGGVYVERIVTSRAGPDGAVQIFQDDFSPSGDSTEALLVTPDLAPGESRTLTAYLGAVPAASGGRLRRPTLVAEAVGGAALGIFKGYLKDVLVNAAEEAVADPCLHRSTLQDKFGAAFDRADAKWNPFGSSEAPFLEVAKSGASAIAEDGLIKRGLSQANLLEDIKSAGEAVARGSDRYERDYGRSVYQPLECGDGRPSSPYPESAGARKSLDPVASFDPNSKAGPAGVGDAGYLTSSGRLTYRVYFENLASATAPAYRVAVVDTLSAVFDPATVESTAESHDGFVFSREGAILTWEIEGIELPPNVTPPEGEGFVEFTVGTVPGLETGTEIANRAEITFDLNAPILTNTHRNVLDLTPPQTTMRPLADEVGPGRVEVAWTSEDGGGSGVATVALFASRDDGPYRQVGVTGGASMEVDVMAGHRYAFYALARDRAGNTETRPPAPAVTAVVTAAGGGRDPGDFRVHDPYPNPAGTAATVTFDLPVGGDVEVSLFDVLGRRALHRSVGRIGPGRYADTIDLRGVAPGVYFVEVCVRTRGHVRFRGAAKVVALE